uniref:Uncharacterized protein n=1 Tax=Arion vulgaris TaxID=1028688 RepID=A0A0B7B9E4_9EUPU
MTPMVVLACISFKRYCMSVPSSGQLEHKVIMQTRQQHNYNKKEEEKMSILCQLSHSLLAMISLYKQQANNSN